MRRKVVMRLDSTLYQRAKEAARQQGRGINEVIEEALAGFLTGDPARASIAAQTRGIFKVSGKALRAVLNEDFLALLD